MKNLIATLCLLASTTFAASDFTITITNSTKVLPQRGVSGPVWAVATAYAQGSYAKNGGTVYMALTSGTSGVAAASAPTHAMGVATPANQSVRWIAVESTDRKAMMIEQWATTGSVSITRGTAAGIGTGTVIGASSTYSDSTCWQGEVWVNATNQSINVSDW